MPEPSLTLGAVKTLDIQVPASTLPLLSYYSTILTLVTAVPAVVTGAYELMPVIRRDGFSSKKAQAGLLHAILNDITLLGAAYNWWTRRGEAGFTPSTQNVLISAVLVPASFIAAYLGGSLVYKYGMGVGRGSANKAKKAQ